jgi:hypothetical protein
MCQNETVLVLWLQRHHIHSHINLTMFFYNPYYVYTFTFSLRDMKGHENKVDFHCTRHSRVHSSISEVYVAYTHDS